MEEFAKGVIRWINESTPLFIGAIIIVFVVCYIIARIMANSYHNRTEKIMKNFPDSFINYSNLCYKSYIVSLCILQIIVLFFVALILPGIEILCIPILGVMLNMILSIVCIVVGFVLVWFIIDIVFNIRKLVQTI
jgi:hypothetical protein